MEQSVKTTRITEFYIQRKPTFTLFKSPLVKQDKKAQTLMFAYQTATSALARQLKADTKSFCKEMLIALQAFIACDSYTFLSELLTSHKQ